MTNIPRNISKLSFSAESQQLEAEQPPRKMQRLKAQAESAGENKDASSAANSNVSATTNASPAVKASINSNDHYCYNCKRFYNSFVSAQIHWQLWGGPQVAKALGEVCNVGGKLSCPCSHIKSQSRAFVKL